MSDQTLQLIAIGVYFAAMIAIGLYAYRKTTSHEDYMLAGRELKPWVAALSAGASDMSGWIMMGLPGALYLSGLIESWIAIGLTIGAYLNWKIVAPRLRAYTERSRNSITIPSFFENRLRDKSRLLRIVSSLIILTFFVFYVAAMMVAGGVFFQESFGSTYLFGLLLVAGVTLAYTLFGGFLGASLTDFVQGTMMMLALLILPVMAVVAIGGIGETIEQINAVDPAHFSMLGGEGFSSAAVLMIVSALGWGLGYFGQPHIIVRFMAMKNPASAKAARRIGMTWMILSLGGAVVGGLVGLAYFSQQGITLADSEVVMLAMAQALFHPLVAGMVLAAVLAAIMSTVSSQLIVCSSALVEDLLKVVVRREISKGVMVMLGRVFVLLVAVGGVLLALNPEGTILELVGFAWAGFGAAFGPIILLSLFWRKLTNWGALAGMLVGTGVVFGWSALDGEVHPFFGHEIFGLYEIIPGFVMCLLIAVVVSLFTYRVDEEIQEEFTDTVTMTRPIKTAR